MGYLGTIYCLNEKHYRIIFIPKIRTFLERGRPEILDDLVEAYERSVHPQIACHFRRHVLDRAVRIVQGMQYRRCPARDGIVLINDDECYHAKTVAKEKICQECRLGTPYRSPRNSVLSILANTLLPFAALDTTSPIVQYHYRYFCRLLSRTELAGKSLQGLTYTQWIAPYCAKSNMVFMGGEHLASQRISHSCFTAIFSHQSVKKYVLDLSRMRPSVRKSMAVVYQRLLDEMIAIGRFAARKRYGLIFNIHLQQRPSAQLVRPR